MISKLHRSEEKTWGAKTTKTCKKKSSLGAIIPGIKETLPEGGVRVNYRIGNGGQGAPSTAEEMRYKGTRAQGPLLWAAKATTCYPCQNDTYRTQRKKVSKSLIELGKIIGLEK